MNVQGIYIPIHLVKGLVDSEECYGDYSAAKEIIRMDADIKGRLRNRTAYHEMLHAWMDKTGAAEDIGDVAEHMIVTTLEETTFENFHVYLKK
jgi:hypothetical protein